MMNLILIMCCIVPALFVLLTTLVAIKAVKRGVDKKVAVFSQIGSAVCVMFMCFLIPGVCKIHEAAEVTSSESKVETAESAEIKSASSMGFAIGLVAAAVVTGLSGIGGGIAVASAAPAAIAATSEDPKAFGKSLIFVALGEGIALYGLLVSIMIFSKIDQLLGV